MEVMEDPLQVCVRIVPFAERASDLSALAAIDDIFFVSSATKSFASEAAREAFRERWLGRFLLNWPEAAFLAVSATGEVLGYIVGAVEDPARDPRFADIAYFAELAQLTADYPAHLHINLAPKARNRGIGGRLIEAFCAFARGRGAAGVHVVTSASSRNRTFYARQSFRELAKLPGPLGQIVMLGRRL